MFIQLSGTDPLDLLLRGLRDVMSVGKLWGTLLKGLSATDVRFDTNPGAGQRFVHHTAILMRGGPAEQCQ